MITLRRCVQAIMVVGIVLVLSGCGAGTPGSTRTLVPPSKEASLDTYDKLVVVIKTAGEVKVTDIDRDRISAAIRAKINEKVPNRFAVINPETPDSTTLRAIVTLTRYDEGNAFARFMLAGLGQIHIDGEVVLENSVTKIQLAQHEVTKTFAWGGVYGVSTRITDVEAGFVEAVVAVILGQDSDSSPKEPSK